MPESDLLVPVDADPSAPKPHCSKCGRFVRGVYGGGRCSEPELYYEYEDSRATCTVHGDVVVSWEPS